MGRRRGLLAAGPLRLAVALFGLHMAARGGSLVVAVVVLLVGLLPVPALARRLDRVCGRDRVLRRLDLPAIGFSVFLIFVGRGESGGARVRRRAGGRADQQQAEKQVSAA